MPWRTITIRNEQELDEHVRWCLANYSILFNTRQDVLFQIFMELGGGYDWTEDGYLVTWADQYEGLPPVDEIPQPDVLTHKPHRFYTDTNAFCVPDNAPYGLREAALEAQRAVVSYIINSFDPGI